MEDKKIYIYYRKSKKRRDKSQYSDIALVRSDNLEDAKRILQNYYDEIDDIIEVKFEDNKNIIIVSDY